MLNLSTNAGTVPASPAGQLTLGPIDFSAISDDPKENFLPRGVYLARVTEARLNLEKNRVELLFDVAEGELKGFFKEHLGAQDFAHTVYLSAEQRRLLRLKADLDAIGSCNPGSNFFSIWNTDIRGFVGKRLIVTVHNAETVNEYGMSIFPRLTILSAQDAATGSYLIPGNVHADGTREPDEPGLPIAFGDHAEETGHEPDPLWGDADA